MFIEQYGIEKKIVEKSFAPLLRTAPGIDERGTMLYAGIGPFRDLRVEGPAE